MNLIKGFVSINTYINNGLNQVAPLGELSSFASTYSREKGEYTSPDHNNLKLTTFKSVVIDTGVHYVATSSQVNHLFEIVGKCLEYSSLNIQPFDSNDFRNSIVNHFVGSITNFNYGPFVSNGSTALPQWLSWTDIANTNNEVKIWLANAAFVDQYDEFEIKVIPPVDSLSTLTGTYNTALTAINGKTMSDVYEEIDDVKAGSPETFLRLLTFPYINTYNTGNPIPTNWTVIVYGKAGDHIDVIKEAIISYILANSTQPLSYWETAIPELFTRTEFVFVPFWHKLSIPNLTTMSALYSSIINVKEGLDFLESVYPTSVYPTNYIRNTTSFMPYDFSGISMAVIPGTTNSPDKDELTDLFPDYISVPTSSLDFSRMSLATQEFTVLLGELLVAAKTSSIYVTLPNDFRRVVRNNVTYISAVHNNVNYMVATSTNSIFTV